MLPHRKRGGKRPRVRDHFTVRICGKPWRVYPMLRVVFVKHGTPELLDFIADTKVREMHVQVGMTPSEMQRAYAITADYIRGTNRMTEACQ